MSREAEALKRWLYKAWDLGTDFAYIVRLVEEGMPLTDAVCEAERLLGMGKHVADSVGEANACKPEFVWVDSKDRPSVT